MQVEFWPSFVRSSAREAEGENPPFGFTKERQLLGVLPRGSPLAACPVLRMQPPFGLSCSPLRCWLRSLPCLFISILAYSPRPLHSPSFLVSSLNQMPAKPLGPFVKVPGTPRLPSGPSRQVRAPSGSCQGAFHLNAFRFPLLSVFFLVFLIQLIALS